MNNVYIIFYFMGERLSQYKDQLKSLNCNDKVFYY